MSIIRFRRPQRWVGALVHSRVPRRLLCGAADPVSGRHLAERYRELVPDAVNVKGGAIAEDVRPGIPLAEQLGRIFTALAGVGAGHLAGQAVDGQLVDGVHDPGAGAAGHAACSQARSRARRAMTSTAWRR